MRNISSTKDPLSVRRSKKYLRISMGLSRRPTVSQINGDLSRKSQFFSFPVYFAPPLKGFPSELDIGAEGQKTRMMGYQAEQKV